MAGRHATETYVDEAVSNATTVPQVVQALKTDTFSESVGQGSFTGDVSGLSCAITPASTGNKVLVTVSVPVSASGEQNINVTLHRNGSPIFQGDAAGSRQRVSSSSGPVAANRMGHVSFQFLDSPDTTSEVIYTVRLSHSDTVSVTLHVNRSHDDSNASFRQRGASSIVAMEVAAGGS